MVVAAAVAVAGAVAAARAGAGVVILVAVIPVVSQECVRRHLLEEVLDLEARKRQEPKMDLQVQVSAKHNQVGSVTICEVEPSQTQVDQAER